ncbi:MAG: choice-of-anchor J domain-containing protein [Muribaculaceae bacterium]|nr:choice-of-anchor J domain-containing protein [Muribaculaceae bacterium]
MTLKSSCRVALAATLLLTASSASPAPQARNLRPLAVKSAPLDGDLRQALRSAARKLNFKDSRAKANDHSAAPVRKLPGSNTVLCGAMVYNDLWGLVDDNGNYLYPITAGIYTFGARPDASPKLVYSAEKMLKMRAGVKVNSIYYTISTSNYDSEAYLTTYYASSWSQRSEQEIDIVNVPSDMTYDPVSGNVYGFFYNDQTQDYDRFCRFDTYYGEAEQIATVDRNAFAIAANKKGEIYGIWGWTGWLIKVDPKTGRYEQIGKTGFAPALINSLTFDDATGKLYWTANDAQGYSALLEVDTSTGAATEICHFENNASFSGIFAMPYKVPDAAPAAVTGASVAYTSPGALTGRVRCTAPVKSANGGSLVGPLTVVVSVSGGETYEIEGVQPGAAVESPEMTFAPGAVSVDITAATADYMGESVTISSWAGEDLPGAPGNVQLSDDNGTPLLSWDAPAAGLNGGTFNADALTYTVVRYPDHATFSGITSTSWRDETFSGMSALRYEVNAVTDVGAGPAASSPTLVFGEGFTVPFTETFSTEADFSLWTVTDLSGGTTWEYSSKNRNIFYKYGTEVEIEGDDWIISPRFRLSAGKVYALTFDARSYYKNYAENFKFALCTSTDPTSAVKVIIDCPDFDVPTGETKRALFSVDADGYYHLGLHCYSIAHNWQLEIDNIGLSEVSGSVPAAVTGLTVTPGEQGAMTARLDFTAPDADSKGNAIDGSMTINVYRNLSATPCHSFTNVSAGTPLSWTDTSFEESGVYTYRVVGVSEAGEGSSAEASAFVGVDVPGAVGNLRSVEAADGSVSLSWTAPVSGANGGWFDASAVTYRIQRSNDAATLADNYTATSFVDNTLKLTSQTLMYYLVTPYVGSAKGRYNNTPLNGVFGPALVAPVCETFPSADLTTYPWVSESNGQQYLWTLETSGTNPSASDQNGDRGLAMFISNSVTKGVTGEFSSPKVSLRGLDSPVLTFWMYGCEAPEGMADEELSVKVMTPGGEWQAVSGATFRRGDSEGWTRHVVDLSAYASAEWVRVMFTATAAGTGNILLDNIAFDSSRGVDIAAMALTGADRVAAGYPFNVAATVTNVGMLQASAVVLTLTDGADVVGTHTVDLLASGASASVELPVTFAASGRHELTLTAACSDDVNAANNAVTLTVDAVEPVIAAPSGLEATASADRIELTWSDPYARGLVVDDMEAHADWAINGFGSYTLVDLDLAATYYIKMNLEEYPDMTSPKAFQVCNAKALGIDIWDEGTPHSGNKMLMSVASVGTPNNDWLISPRLNGAGQTVSFFAKAFTADDTPAERMRVLYSTGGTDPSEFTAINSGDYIEVPDIWTEYRFVVPAGATHFAINCVSADAFALFVDDIAFNDLTVPALEVSGYEVLRNGEVIATTADRAFADEAPLPGRATYTVRARYADGVVSAQSEGVSVEFSSIDGVAAAGVTVSGGRGVITVANAAGLDVELFAVDGRRLAASTAHGDRLELRALPGVYLLTIDSRPYKVRVD